MAMRSSTTVLKGRPFAICLNDRTAWRVDIVGVMINGERTEKDRRDQDNDTHAVEGRRQGDCN